jgi:hypothetical protein
MPIAFKCPNCQKGYKVKDELAGRSVVCTACKARIRVPAPIASGAVPSHEAESLAVEALADEPIVDAAPADFIEMECPQCMEQVKFEARFGGKQAPCPSCRRIIRVPMAETGKPKNWRETAARPSLAKQEEDPALEGHWGSVTQGSIVSRDALEEAAVIVRRRAPMPVRTKVYFAITGVLIAGLAVWGVLKFKNRRADIVREDYVKKGLDLLKGAGDTVSPLAAAAARRGAAEYYLNLREPSASDAKQQLEAARSLIIDAPPGQDGGIERLLLLTEVALTQADLTGGPAEVKANARLPWEKVTTELRKSLEPLQRWDPSLHDGIVLLQERLSRRLGSHGGPNQPMFAILPSQLYNSPQNDAEGLAVVGLEWVARKQDDQAKAVAEQARQHLGGPSARAPARLAALLLTLNPGKPVEEVRPPAATGEPPHATRIAYCESWARQGKLDEARQLADAPGPFEHRFQAKVIVAEAAAEKDPNPSDVKAAVDFLANELGNRDLPDWSLIRLGQLCARTPGDAGKALVEFLQRLPNVSPRGQAIRAWVVMEIMRSPRTGVPLTGAAVKEITPQTCLGAIVAWEALARRNAAERLVSNPTTVIETWPAAARPAAFVGTALGLQDSDK